MFTDVLSVAKFIMNVGIGTYVGITLCRWGWCPRTGEGQQLMVMEEGKECKRNPPLHGTRL